MDIEKENKKFFKDFFEDKLKKDKSTKECLICLHDVVYDKDDINCGLCTARMHKKCFKTYYIHKKNQSLDLDCPMCRAVILVMPINVYNELNSRKKLHYTDEGNYLVDSNGTPLRMIRSSTCTIL